MKHQRLMLLVVGAAAAVGVLVVFAATRTRGRQPVALHGNSPPHAAADQSEMTRQVARDGSAFDHRTLDELLAAHIDGRGLVDYEGLRRKRPVLDSYLDRVAEAAPQTFKDDKERLAFWINAYNAFTLRDVLDDVYQKARSVKKVPGFFDKKTHRVAGEELTLNDIEQRGLALRDPRIHFAINCASNSCPALQSFAYTGDRLESQLGEATQEFLSDPERGLRVDKKRNRVLVSPVFKWYEEDFRGAAGAAKNVRGANSLFAGDQLNRMWQAAGLDVFQFIEERRPEVGYLDYDWSLNSQPARGKAASSGK